MKVLLINQPEQLSLVFSITQSIVVSFLRRVQLFID